MLRQSRMPYAIRESKNMCSIKGISISKRSLIGLLELLNFHQGSKACEAEVKDLDFCSKQFLHFMASPRVISTTKGFFWCICTHNNLLSGGRGGPKLLCVRREMRYRKKSIAKSKTFYLCVPMSPFLMLVTCTR